MGLQEVSSRCRLVRPQCCTQTSESFFSSAWLQALKMTGRRNGVDCLVGISVCIEQHVKGFVLSRWRSLPYPPRRHFIITVLSDPYIERATFAGTWLQWPHWDVMLLMMPPTRKARGPDAAAGRSQQATSPCWCCGNFTASHWICMLSCYLMVCPSLPRRTCTSNAHYATTSTQCSRPRTACQSYRFLCKKGSTAAFFFLRTGAGCGTTGATGAVLVLPSPSTRVFAFSLSEDRKSTRLNSSHSGESRMPSSA